MNICIITPDFSGGGAQEIAITTANYFNSKGYLVKVISFGRNGPMIKRLNKKIDLTIFKAKNYFSFAMYFKFEQIHFDHVISFIRHTNIALYIAYKFKRIKVSKIHLIEVNTFDQQKIMPFLSKVFQNFLLKIAYNDVDDLIAVSKKIKFELIKKFNIKKNLRVLGNPILALNNLNKLSKIKKNKKKINFVSAGRFHEQKDFMMMLDAFNTHHKSKKLCKDTLTIFGEGQLRQEMENFINHNNLKKFVLLPGFVENLQDKLKKYDIFLLTSKYEGFGNVIIMAMAAGLPVVAKKYTGGPDDIINKKNGLLFIDKLHLVKILSAINIKNYDYSDLYSTAANYSIEKICDKYLL